jgi:uncharacterized protein (TIGR02217 family)
VSLSVFPTLAGLTWDITRSPQFSTLVQRSVSGRELRAGQFIYPLTTFTLAYDLLRDTPNVTTPSSPQDELKKLIGFFESVNGSLTAFAFDDPADDSVTDMQFGTGDGLTAAFQLIRTYGVSQTFSDPVQNVNAMVNVKDNGSTIPPGAGAGKYTISSTGVVTFGTVPTAGHPLTWSGSYYYRVRFLQDMSEFNQFMQNLYNLKKLSFIGSVVNKV